MKSWINILENNSKAMSDLKGLPDWKKENQAKVPFKFKERPWQHDDKFKAARAKATEQGPVNIKLKNITAIEEYVFRDEVEKIIKDFSLKKFKTGIRGDVKPPRIVKYKNKHYIYDGHHRMTSAHLLGLKTVPVFLIDLDKYN